MNRAQTNAAHAEATTIAGPPLERATSPHSPLPLYSIEDRRPSGEWIVIGQVRDPLVAHELAAILRSVGADIRIELLPQPFIA